MMNEHAQIGPYTLQRLLGGGGMADVYLAWDNNNRWPVALKLLRAATGQDARMLKRFEREAALLMKLRHPHIIQVYDAGQTADGRPYIAMEYVTGGDLVDLLHQRKGNKLAVSEALYLMRRVAGAMAYAHERGIVHRDLKPSNILLRADTGEPVIADLGIAALAGAKPLTGTMEALGTPQYMAPEQGAHHGAADGRADVYAIGVMLYELLTGRLPFEGDNGWALLLQKQQEDAPPVLSRRRDLDPRLAAVVDTCLRRDPAARYPTAGALATALDAFLPADARPPAPVAPRAKKNGESLTPVGPLTPGGLTGYMATSGATSPARGASPRRWMLAAALLVGLLAVGALVVWPRLRGGAPTANEVTPVAELPTGGTPATATEATAAAVALEATSTTAATVAPPTDTPPPTATQANLPTANFVSPADGAVLPTGRPVEIVLAAGDATGLASLTLTIDGRPFAEYEADGEKLYARTLIWEAPNAEGEIVLSVAAVNVEGVRGQPQAITVSFVEAEVEPTATGVPTHTPVATLRQTTATPGAAATPGNSPAATAAPVAASPAGPAGPATLLGFEAFGAWRIGQPNGTLTQSSEQTHGGSFAAKLAYNFPGPGNDFVDLTQERDIEGTPNALQLWVYGDNAGHYLNVWIIDDEGERWSVPLGRIQHTGWQRLTGAIDAETGWPGGHVSGPDNGQIDYPIRFSSIVLDDPSDDYVGQGTIYLDDLVVTTIDE